MIFTAATTMDDKEKRERKKDLIDWRWGFLGCVHLPTYLMFGSV